MELISISGDFDSLWTSPELRLTNYGATGPEHDQSRIITMGNSLTIAVDITVRCDPIFDGEQAGVYVVDNVSSNWIEFVFEHNKQRSKIFGLGISKQPETRCEWKNSLVRYFDKLYRHSFVKAAR